MKVHRDLPLSLADDEFGVPWIGGYAKVRVPGESFWAEVLEYPDSDGLILCRLANNVYTLGLKADERLYIRAENVVDELSAFEAERLMNGEGE